jgi:hypothetical protein
MKIFFLAVISSLFFSYVPRHIQYPTTIILFDGKTFDGWQGDTIHTWRIETGALVGGSLIETVPHNDFFAALQTFKNFDLQLQFKLTGTGFVNAGVQFRSQRLANPDYEMAGYQADLGEGYWGSLYDESRRNKTLAQPDSLIIKKILRANDWNHYRIRCNGKKIQIWLNDVLTVDYTEAEDTIAQWGLIALQIHGGGKAEVAYKNLQLTRLPD